MISTEPVRSTFDVEGAGSVSAVATRPPAARACFVFAHGAGAGMDHPFMASIADGLAVRGIACLRYQFPFTERASRRPDPPAVAHAAVRAAVAEAGRRMPELPLVAGGKSFGGRMTSQAQAMESLPGVRGLVFIGFPLHPTGEPSDKRAVHLTDVRVPMLFLQGTRDALAHLPLIEALASRLGRRATLRLLDGADHSFHVPARSGRRDDEVREELLDALSGWVDVVLGDTYGDLDPALAAR